MPFLVVPSCLVAIPCRAAHAAHPRSKSAIVKKPAKRRKSEFPDRAARRPSNRQAGIAADRLGQGVDELVRDVDGFLRREAIGASLTDAERLAFFQEIIPLVKPENIRWKATDWENPTEWIPRGRGLTT